MDVVGPHPYVRRVNLLLLLSALFSVLTGAQAGARVAPAPVAVSRTAERAVADRAVRATMSGRPVVALPDVTQVASAGVARAWRLLAAVPPFTGRRRE